MMPGGKIKQIKKSDGRFPKILKKIDNCPSALYFRGEWDESLFEKGLAIVGSRKMTRYGREAIARFMPELVTKGITIISGFMYGVDCEAHRNCLDLGGRTMAVLGWGLDHRPVDEKLYKKILKGKGLVISEYEADFKPTRWSFPQRNRIVSGLASLGALVIEGSLKSGSLITARLARTQGRKVWAVPGPITSTVSTGTNWLIKRELAKMVTEAGDILGENTKVTQVNMFADNLDKIEAKIIDILDREAMTVDELARNLDLTVIDMMSKISSLSMNNRIEEENGKIYLKK